MSVDVTIMGEVDEVDEVDEVFTCEELAAIPIMCSMNIKKNLDV